MTGHLAQPIICHSIIDPEILISSCHLTNVTGSPAVNLAASRTI
jgi:hypothetical protein